MSNLLDDFEGIDDAFDEAWRPRVSRPGPYRPSAGPGVVTQADLQAAMSKVRVEIEKNSSAILSVNRSAAAATERQTKINTATTKEIENLRGELRQATQISAMLPLLAASGSVKVRTVDGPETEVVKKGDSFSSLLPLLLLSGGLGGSAGSSTSSGSAGMGGDSMLMFALVMAMSNK